jgi:hypothetical protein
MRNIVKSFLGVVLLVSSSIIGSVAADMRQGIQASVKDVGQVTFVETASRLEPAIVILPEWHGFPLLQLEQALIFERLKSTLGLGLIVLEGATTDDTKKSHPALVTLLLDSRSSARAHCRPLNS